MKYRAFCALALAAAVAATGCGDDGGTSDAKAGSAAIGKSTSTSKRDSAAKAGAAAAEAAGDPVAVPKKTIGVLQLVGAAEAISRATAGVREAAGQLGWKVNVCDGQGDPTKVAGCAQTLLAQKPDVMISVAVEAAVVKPQMERAKRQDVPWINISGPAAPSPLFTTQIVYDETKVGQTNAQYIIEKLGGKGTLATDNLDAVYAVKVRGDAFMAALQGSDIKVIDNHATDLSKAVPDYKQWATATLTRNPKLGAMNSMGDIEALGQVPALQQKFPGKHFPDRPLATSFFGNLSSLDAIRKGQLDAVTEVPLEATGWMAVDQSAEHVARGKAYAKDPQAEYEVKFLEPYVVTKDNVPAGAKAYVDPPTDFVTFFTTKFAKEFTGQ